jgi:hypothetical protein
MKVIRSFRMSKTIHQKIEHHIAKGNKIFPNVKNYSSKDRASYCKSPRSFTDEINNKRNSHVWPLAILAIHRNTFSEPFCSKYLALYYRKPIHRAICTSLHFRRKIWLQKYGASPPPHAPRFLKQVISHLNHNFKTFLDRVAASGCLTTDMNLIP